MLPLPRSSRNPPTHSTCRGFSRDQEKGRGRRRRRAAAWRERDVRVCGSVARGGNHIDSDVDLIYSMGPEHKATAGTIMGLKDDLERHLGKHVSLISKRALLFNVEHTASGRLFYNAIRADPKQVL
nr:nucleotidyltransferase domain-containing protein [Bifidobacterium pullorum]